MLAGVYEDLLVLRSQRPGHGRRLDELRPVAYDGEDPHRRSLKAVDFPRLRCPAGPLHIGAARCYTTGMPTSHPRHMITETPPVREALDELRAKLKGERIDFAELVIM